MWELGHKEGWVQKNWCFWTVVLEKTLESPLDCKEIQPVHPKGNQSWIFTGRTDGETEAPKLRPPNAKSRLIKEDPEAWEDWIQEAKGMTEDKMVGWHDQLDEYEFEQGPSDDEGQGGLTSLQFMGSQRVRHGWATEKHHHLQLSYQNIFSTPKETLYPLMCVCAQGHVLSHVRLFFNPMDCSPPGSSVHGILQARMLEWVAISSPAIQ